MMYRMKQAKWLALLPVLVLADACSLLPNANSGCDKVQSYQSAQDLPPLRVPDGAMAPDTRNALRIPTVNTPQVPAAPGACLDHPPDYVAKPATG
ncbi:MAG: hypothetical protein ACRER4_05950 [Steroidobacteraceae bacterium]